MTNAWTAELEPELEQPRAPSAPRQPRKIDGGREEKRRHAYVEAAVLSETEAVRTAGRGTRNDTLNRAAFALGQFVGGGLLERQQALQELTAAAEQAGLGKSETRKTITSGLDAGEQEPRELPESEQRVTADAPGDVTYDDFDQRVDDFEEATIAGGGVGLISNAGPGKADKQPAPSEWTIIPPEQLFGPLSEPVYLIAGIIRVGGLLEIQAYGGSGKSWLAVNLALCVATGLPWLGMFEVKRCNVVCLDYENGFYEMARRFQANARALRLATPVAGLGLITMPDRYMTSDGFESSVAKLAATYQLIVIDTLKAASPGVDENDSKMRESLDRLRRVGERTGCTFVVLIHSKKKSNSAVEIDARERGRGSSAIYDAADAQLGVEYEPDKPLKVIQTKARSGRYVEPFEVTISDGDDGAVHVVAQALTKAIEAGTGADRFEANCTRVLEAVRANPGSSQGPIREALGIRNQTVSAALEHLERHGAVRNAGTKASPKWFPTGAGGRS